MMNEDSIIEQLRELKYGGKVDVTEAVMEKVRKRPLLAPQPEKSRWVVRRIASAVAAIAIILVGTNIFNVFFHEYDIAQMSDDITTVYDYHADYALANDVDLQSDFYNLLPD